MYRVLHQRTQHPTQGFPAAGFGDHTAALHDAAEGGDGADLVADEGLDGGGEGGGGDRAGGVGLGGVVGEGDEGEGEVAFEGVGDGHDTAFDDGGVSGDCLFDGA